MLKRVMGTHLNKNERKVTNFMHQLIKKLHDLIERMVRESKYHRSAKEFAQNYVNSTT